MKQLTEEEYSKLKQVLWLASQPNENDGLLKGQRARIARQQIAEALFTELQMRTGCRPEEVVRMTRSDVDVAESTVYIHAAKGSQARPLPVASEFMVRFKHGVLANCRHDGPLATVICPLKFTKQNAKRSLRRAWKRIAISALGAERCNQLGVYCLRHTFAERVYEVIKSTGGDLIDLQTTMGHVSLNSTQQYMRKRAMKALHPKILKAM